MISQPSLTKTIKHLEAELNTSLFDHSGSQISLSKKREVALKYTNRILQNVEDMRQELNDLSHVENNTIRITVMAAASVIPRYILGFKKLFPDVNINITQINDITPNQSVLEKCDYFIYSSVDKPDSEQIITLLQEPCLLALPSNHIKSSDKFVHIKDCSHEQFLILRQKSPLCELTNVICEKAGFAPHIDLTCDSWETIYSLIEAGMGISLIPSLTWNASNQPRHIILKQMPFPVYRYINLKWHKDCVLSENAILFQKYLISFFQELI